MAVRHDRNVFPLDGDLSQKKKKKRIIERGRDVSRRTAHLAQTGRLMLFYIGCRSASPPSSIGSWFPNQLLPHPPPLFLCSSKTVFAQVDSDIVLNEPQCPPPPSLFHCIDGCKLCHQLSVSMGLQRAAS